MCRYNGHIEIFINAMFGKITNQRIITLFPELQLLPFKNWHSLIRAQYSNMLSLKLRYNDNLIKSMKDHHQMFFIKDCNGLKNRSRYLYT